MIEKLNVLNLLDLIQSAEVEWTTLGEVAEISKGKQLNKDLLTETGEFPVINGGINPSGFWHEYNTDENTITVSQGGASAGFVNWMTVKFFAGAHCYVVKPDEDVVMNRYVYHFVKLNQSKFQEKQYGAGIPALSKAELSNLTIPIPSLEIQQKVVEILDKMTDYVTELTAELTLRQKQYAYYRDKLLTFPSQSDSDESLGVEWRVLGEICEIKRGKRLVKNELEEVGKYPVYQNSMTPLGYYHQFNFDGDNTFIICAGAAGEIGYMSENFWAADDVSVLTVPSNLMSRYLYHFLLTKQNSIKSKVRRASVPRLSKISFENIKIPVPTLSEQKRIVEILDSFDKLTSNLTDGLPHEIKLRKKQYEYWREQLLSFKRE